MDRLHSQVHQLLSGGSGQNRRTFGEFPAVNIWTGADEVLVTAEIPGVNPDTIEVTVKDETVTLRGSRDHDELKEGDAYLRHERGAGSFVRSFALPFRVEADKVKAQYRRGVLELTLPRAEADKPKRIAVKAA